MPPPKLHAPLSQLLHARWPIHILVFGGSISRGHGAIMGYAAQLEQLVACLGLNATVANLAIPATGVTPMLDCAPALGKRADVIISEFAVNEKNPTRLRSWYAVASQLAASTVDLELWSWAAWNNSYPSPAAAVAAASASDIGVVDTRAGAQHFWPHTPPFTPGELFNDFKSSTSDHMHGNSAYHALATLALGWYLWGDWGAPRPNASHASSPALTTRSAPAYGLRKERCYGNYGMWGAPDPNISEVNATAFSWEPNSKMAPARPPLTAASLGVVLDGFIHGDPFGRGVVHGARKVSLYARKAGATFSFMTPACCDGLKLGFVHHTHESDGAWFEVFASGKPRTRILSQATGPTPSDHDSAQVMHLHFFTSMMAVAPETNITVRVVKLATATSVVEITTVILKGCLALPGRPGGKM